LGKIWEKILVGGLPGDCASDNCSVAQPARKTCAFADETDFEAVLSLLDESQGVWLADSIAVTGPDHPWRNRLISQGTGGCPW
jgi:hypothetical protein